MSADPSETERTPLADGMEEIQDEDGNVAGYRLRNPYDKLRQKVHELEQRVKALEDAKGRPAKVGNDEAGSPELQAALAEKTAKLDAASSKAAKDEPSIAPKDKPKRAAKPS